MDTAAELEAIRRLKYAYFRTLDLKEFDQLGALLTEDATASYEDGKTVLEGRAAIVSWLQSALADPGIVTEHHGHHPELTFSSDTEATGTWYLQDRVIVPGRRPRDRRHRLLRGPLPADERGLADRTHGLYPGLRGAPHPLDAGGALLYISLRCRRAEREAGVEEGGGGERLLNGLDEVGLELDVERLDVLRRSARAGWRRRSRC